MFGVSQQQRWTHMPSTVAKNAFLFQYSNIIKIKFIQRKLNSKFKTKDKSFILMSICQRRRFSCVLSLNVCRVHCRQSVGWNIVPCWRREWTIAAITLHSIEFLLWIGTVDFFFLSSTATQEWPTAVCVRECVVFGVRYCVARKNFSHVCHHSNHHVVVKVVVITIERENFEAFLVGCSKYFRCSKK